MFDDSFDFKSFTVDIILNSLEKIFRFFALINIKITDMIFINESLMLELCVLEVSIEQVNMSVI